MFRRPALGLAEIAWRWSFAFASALLLTFCFLEYLDTLPVTARDLLFLRSRQPFLISQAAAHILRGSGPRLVAAAIVLVPALAIAWIALASLGRAATGRALLEYFRLSASGLPTDRIAQGARPYRGSFHWRPLLGLNCFRVAATLAAAVGTLAALLLGGAASSDSDPSPGSALLVFLTVVMLVWLAWSVMNWVLSLAGIFAIRDQRDTFDAISAVADLCRVQPGPVFAACTWFGLAHIVAFFVASSIVAFPLAFAGVLPAGVVLGGVLFVTLLYFAAVDFLYLGRLAAFVALLERPAPESIQQSVPSIQPPASLQPPALRPMSDDDILCDIPGIVPPPQTAGS